MIYIDDVWKVNAMFFFVAMLFCQRLFLILSLDAETLFVCMYFLFGWFQGRTRLPHKKNMYKL